MLKILYHTYKKIGSIRSRFVLIFSEIIFLVFIMNDEKFFEFNPNIKAVIVSNIRKYRKQKGYTQEQLALYTDLSYDFIRRIETGKGKFGFSVNTLYKISVVLEVSLDDLIRE